MFIYILSILSLINMNASISFKTTTLRVFYVENSILGQLEFGTFFYIPLYMLELVPNTHTCMLVVLCPLLI